MDGRRWRVGREGTPVQTVVAEDAATRDGVPLLNDIVREGARRMLAAALEAEVAAYLAELAGDRDAQGHRLVVRNGYRAPRTVTTSAGAIEVTAPRVNDKRMNEASGQRQRFCLMAVADSLPASSFGRPGRGIGKRDCLHSGAADRSCFRIPAGKGEDREQREEG